MDRKKCIKHDDNLFSPKEDKSPSWMIDLAMAAPIIGVLLAGFVLMILDILGVLA